MRLKIYYNQMLNRILSIVSVSIITGSFLLVSCNNGEEKDKKIDTQSELIIDIPRIDFVEMSES